MIPHFTVRDMDALAATLKERHVPWLREPKDEGWDIEAFVADPDGYQWAFVAPSRQRAASR
ncbi:MAG: VOC family protein [Deltaproteobacteria bacterium]|nr:MAG: VOC family protein [Deltaproteobacteria bacterium]